MTTEPAITVTLTKTQALIAMECVGLLDHQMRIDHAPKDAIAFVDELFGKFNIAAAELECRERGWPFDVPAA